MELVSLAENRPKVILIIFRKIMAFQYTVHQNGGRIRIMRIKEFLKSSFCDPETPNSLFLSKPLVVIKNKYSTWDRQTFMFSHNFNVHEDDVVGVVIDRSENCPINFMFRTSEAVPDTSTQLLFDEGNV